MSAEPMDLRAAGEILRTAVPGATAVEVVPRTGGQLSAVHEVRCAGGRESVIVKVYAEQWRWKQAKEVHVYGLLGAAAGLPVPTVLQVEPDPSLLGSVFTVMTRLPGRPLSEVRTEVAAADLPGIYRRMGGILSEMHRISQDSYGYLTTEILDPQPDNSAYMVRRFAAKLGEFRTHGGDPALHDAIEAHVGERAGSFAGCTSPALCHNDFHEGNVLVAHGTGGWEVTGLVDVENAVAADPLTDLAKTDYYSLHGDEARLSWLFDGYGGLPADARDRLALYRIHHALELWDWFASLGENEHLPAIAGDLRRMVG